MLSLLTDEQISPAVARQVRALRPDVPIESLRDWQGGAFEGVADDLLLLAARDAGLTLITYDQKTIPPVLLEWGGYGQGQGHGQGYKEHAGVIFVDNFTISQANIADIGGLVSAIIGHWDRTRDWDWTSRIDYLRPDR